MNKKNFALLGAIITSMSNEAAPYHMASLAAVKGLATETPPLVETNPEIADGDKVAVRASEAGVAFYNDPANKAKYEAASEPKPKPELTIGTGFVVPDGIGGGSKKAELYPFDTLEVGGFIFVPKSDAKPNPAKSLASTVSAATKRYSVEVPGKTRTGRGGKVVPLTINTRVFTVVPMTAGMVAGAFTAPSDGAAIVRIADHVEPEAPAA